MNVVYIEPILKMSYCYPTDRIRVLWRNENRAFKSPHKWKFYPRSAVSQNRDISIKFRSIPIFISVRVELRPTERWVPLAKNTI